MFKNPYDLKLSNLYYFDNQIAYYKNHQLYNVYIQTPKLDLVSLYQINDDVYAGLYLKNDNSSNQFRKLMNLIDIKNISHILEQSEFPLSEIENSYQYTLKLSGMSHSKDSLNILVGVDNEIYNEYDHRLSDINECNQMSVRCILHLKSIVTHSAPTMRFGYVYEPVWEIIQMKTYAPDYPFVKCELSDGDPDDDIISESDYFQ